MKRFAAAVSILTALLTACSGPSRAVTFGAAFPLAGMQAPLAREELAGVQIAVQVANRAGGWHGRPIRLDVRSLTDRLQAPAVMAHFQREGVPLVIGAYSSQLSIPAAAAASADGMVYWEAGAVADRLTGRPSPLVFRVGADGADLGDNSGRFAAQVLAPRLGRPVTRTSVALVYEDDAYGQSVHDAAAAAVRAAGMPVVADIAYDAYRTRWQPVMGQLAAAHPDVLILASYIPDGVSFRRAMLAAHLSVGAMIGSTMAECGPDFGDELGPDAVGVFSSDRPEGNFNQGALGAGGLAAYRQLASAWTARTRQAVPGEEALAGYAAAWALVHDVLPRTPALTPDAIAGAARAADEPDGSLPNGAGLRFDLGQNTLASSVIWQWQAPRHNIVVWPAGYATGTPLYIPLPA